MLFHFLGFMVRSGKELLYTTRLLYMPCPKSKQAKEHSMGFFYGKKGSRLGPIFPFTTRRETGRIEPAFIGNVLFFREGTGLYSPYHLHGSLAPQLFHSIYSIGNRSAHFHCPEAVSRRDFY
ncbi:hypothetical protein AMTRI_Chr01g103550 [Amborella trichopoda]